jgi:hypothetical protein
MVIGYSVVYSLKNMLLQNIILYRRTKIILILYYICTSLLGSCEHAFPLLYETLQFKAMGIVC